MIITPTNSCCRDEKLKLIILVGFNAILALLLHQAHLLLSVPAKVNIINRVFTTNRHVNLRGEAEILLVAPQHGRTRLDLRVRQDVVQNDNLIARLLADNHKHGAMARLDAILDERAKAVIEFLSHGGHTSRRSE